MNHLISHTRSICVYFKNNQILYTIPLIFEKEQKIFQATELTIKVDTEKPTVNQFIDEKAKRIEGCCPKK